YLVGRALADAPVGEVQPDRGREARLREEALEREVDQPEARGDRRERHDEVGALRRAGPGRVELSQVGAREPRIVEEGAEESLAREEVVELDPGDGRGECEQRERERQHGAETSRRCPARPTTVRVLPSPRMAPRVLVTGGNGFLGSAVVRELRARG